MARSMAQDRMDKCSGLKSNSAKDPVFLPRAGGAYRKIELKNFMIQYLQSAEYTKRCLASS